MSLLVKFRKHLLVSLLLSLSVIGIIAANLSSCPLDSVGPLDVPPGPEMVYFHFGYSETFADSTWLRSLQNFSSCEQDRGGSSYAPNGARMGPDRTPACSRGWLFRVLNVVLELAPRFHVVALIGPTVLSAVVDDIDGASDLYLKAVKLFPNDWVILSRAGSHFALEVENFPLAAKLYIRAVENGAPTWMALYASKLWSKDGQQELSRRILMRFRDNSRLTDRDREYIEKKLGPKK